MRIKNMKRFILSLTILFLLISFLCSMIYSRVFSYTEPEYKEIIVSEGDTLWSIASNLKGNVNLGTRETFADIGKTILDFFNVENELVGKSFLNDIRK